MLIVVDTCCLDKVFDPRNREHSRFAPLLEWISFGRGRMVYGGAKYLAELRRVPRILRLLVELNKKGRVQILQAANVNLLAEELKREVDERAFNDEHIVAIVIVARCRIVCTDDNDAMGYLKRRELYKEHNLKRPSIYSRCKHERFWKRR